MRTVLNALVKCLFSIGYIAVHFCCNIVVKMKRETSTKQAKNTSVNEIHKSGEVEDGTPPVTSDPRVSLLGPLPHYYTTSTDSRTNSKTSKTKYI